MQAAKRVSIHVVGVDFGAAFSDFLASLEEQSTQDFQLLAVDNATLDGAGRINELPNMVVLRNVKKQSFSRCQNQLIRLALARWDAADAADRFILVTRPDVILSPKALQQMLDVMEKNAECGMAVPRILRANIKLVDDGERREFDLTREELSRGYAVTRGRIIIPVEAKEGGANTRLFAPTPHAFLIRAAALKETGCAFDEALSKVPAVLDLAWSVRLAGWNVCEAAEATLWLEPHQEPVRIPDCMRAISNQAADEYAEWRLVQVKNDSPFLRMKHAPWIFTASLLLFLRFALHPWNVFRFLQSLPLRAKMLEKRRKRDMSHFVSRETQERWFV